MSINLMRIRPHEAVLAPRSRLTEASPGPAVGCLPARPSSCRSSILAGSGPCAAAAAPVSLGAASRPPDFARSASCVARSGRSAPRSHGIPSPSASRQDGLRPASGKAVARGRHCQLPQVALTATHRCEPHPNHASPGTVSLHAPWK
jgi:hypothetical protein